MTNNLSGSSGATAVLRSAISSSRVPIVNDMPRSERSTGFLIIPQTSYPALSHQGATMSICGRFRIAG